MKAEDNGRWPVERCTRHECAQNFPNFFALLFLLTSTKITEIRLYVPVYGREIRWTRDVDETEWEFEQFEEQY